MVKNYFKAALRNLLRQKVTSFINMICMAIAIGCSIVAYLFVDMQINREWMHVKRDNIFLVQHQAIKDGDLLTLGMTPVPLGPAMETNLTHITRCVRIGMNHALIRLKDEQQEERVRMADPQFMEMFTFPLKYGDPKSLSQKDAVILSEETAKKYFGDENPIGSTMSVTLAGQEERLFTVRAVAAQTVTKTCAAFTILMSYENLYEDAGKMNDWSQLTNATFVEVDDPENLDAISSNMTKYVALMNEADTVNNNPVKAFTFTNLDELILKSGDVKYTIAGRIPWPAVIVLSCIALFLLLLACFNFISISIAMAGARVKEIGIRKVVGGNIVQLIFQFLSENMLICLIVFLIAIGITQAFLLPAFNVIAGSALEMNFIAGSNLWLFVIVLLVAVAIISGTYPAYYISSFQPIAVLRDRLKFSSKNRFMQFLLAFQFVLAFITMMASVGLTLNALNMRERDWGYNKENILVVKTETPEQYNLMWKVASERPNVVSLTAAQQHVGAYNRETSTKVNDKEIWATIFSVGPNYLQTMNIEIKEGQFPRSRDAVVINETYIRRANWKNAIGQLVKIDTINYIVAGVVKDFHHENFQREIDPLVFRLGEESAFTHVVMRTAPETAIQLSKILEKTWKRNFADVPFDHFFQDQTFDDMYKDTKGIMQIFIFTTVLALLMSCVGLFGLASQRALSKLKEVCIRKVFGIPVGKAILLVNGNFVVLLIIAALIATPISYFILNALLDSIYKYRMEVGASPFVISYVLVFTTMVVTLLKKIYEVVITNPAEILRNE